MLRVSVLVALLTIAHGPLHAAFARQAPDAGGLVQSRRSSSAGEVRSERTTRDFAPFVAHCDIPIAMAPYGLPGVSPANPATHTLANASTSALLMFELAIEEHGEIGAQHACHVYDATKTAGDEASSVTMTGIVLERYLSSGRWCVHTRHQLMHHGDMTMTDDARFCQASDGFYVRLPAA